MVLLRPITSCLLVAVLLVSRTWQQSIPGFSNVRFTVQPQDRYLLPINSFAVFNCEAEGISDSTNSPSPISVVIYINGVPLNRFNPPSRYFIFTNGGPLNIPTGVGVDEVQLPDNGMRVHCQVADCPSDGTDCTGLGINSTVATLVVADGRPPAIPLTQSNSTIRSITVTWLPVLVPEDGPLTSYNVTLFDSQSNQTLSNEVITDPVNVTEHTFVDLDPETSYRAAIIGINKYGVGNRTMEPLDITTATPIVPGPPENVKTERFPVTQILVTWTAPTIDPHKQTPVTRYVLSYHPVDVPQNITSVNISADSNLQHIIPAAEAGTNYSIILSAVNTAGLSLPALANILTAPTNVTPSIPQQAVPQTSSANLQFTSSIMPTPSFTPIISSSISSITTSILSVSTSSAAAFTSSSSSVVADTTTSRPVSIMSTSASDQSSRNINLVQSVVMESPTRPQANIPNPTAASVVIIASAAVALALIIVILIIAVALIVVCVKNMRHETSQVDFPGDLPKEWNSGSRPDNKRSSILKDASSVSSDSNEMSNRSSLSHESPTPRLNMCEIEV